MRAVNFLLIFLAVLLATTAASATSRDGETVYAENCAACHSSGSPRTPTLANLKKLETGRIVHALESGVMRVIGTFELNGPERVAVAEHITGEPYDAGWRGIATSECSDPDWPAADPFARPHWNGWGGSLGNTRFQSARNAGLNREDVPRLQLKWAFAIP